ncbi:MAG: ATP synthase F1 subunit gamma [Anaerolineae bacterium]
MASACPPRPRTPCGLPSRTSRRRESTRDVANVRQIARRIGTVRNLGQVTRAMQMISASRLRRAQERALAARPYAEKTWELIRTLGEASGGEVSHPLLVLRPVRRRAMVIIASDRGLCGGYNNAITRLGLSYSREQEAPTSFIAVGRRAREAVLAHGGYLIAEFEGIPADLTLAFASPIARLIEDSFLAGDFDAVTVAYTRFVSVISQLPRVQEILPIAAEATVGHGGAEGAPARVELLYEPSPSAILDTLLPHSLEIEILGFLLESVASEHAARMVAMRSATDNSAEMVEELQRTYNRARQATITGEIVDIAAATEALRR